MFAGLSPMSDAERAGSHCGEGERVVYTCTAKGKVFSVCVSAALVTYRFGPIGHPEITLASDGYDGLYHYARIVGGVGGSQQSIGFIHSNYEYVVYSAEYGQETLRPGNLVSGVVVMKDGIEVSRILCPEKGQRQWFNAERLHESEDKYGWLCF